MEALVQQMITAGSGEMQQNAAETVQRIETAVAAICDNSSVKAGQQMENALTNHGASVKGAISRLSETVAASLKPVIEEKVREAVKGMIAETVKNLNAAQCEWQKSGQKRIREMIS